jgi:hypothetical protein
MKLMGSGLRGVTSGRIDGVTFSQKLIYSIQ